MSHEELDLSKAIELDPYAVIDAFRKQRDDAVSTIDRVLHENTKLCEKIKILTKDVQQWQDLFYEHAKQMRKLKSDNARMRKAAQDKPRRELVLTVPTHLL